MSVLQLFSRVSLCLFSDSWVKSSLHTSQVAIRPERFLISDFYYEATWIISTPMEGMLVHLRVTPNIKLAGAHLYSWLDRSTARLKFLCQEPLDPKPSALNVRPPLLPSACDQMQCVNTTVLIVDTEISRQILYNEQEHVNNPNWWEADQLAIYLQSVEELNLGPPYANPCNGRKEKASRVQIRRANH